MIESTAAHQNSGSRQDFHVSTFDFHHIRMISLGDINLPTPLYHGRWSIAQYNGFTPHLHSGSHSSTSYSSCQNDRCISMLSQSLILQRIR